MFDRSFHRAGVVTLTCHDGILHAELSSGQILVFSCVDLYIQLGINSLCIQENMYKRVWINGLEDVVIAEGSVFPESVVMRNIRSERIKLC
jgi:hypothetical protein